ncbi:hypothetical protein D1872_321990 [compost metagenome]
MNEHPTGGTGKISSRANKCLKMRLTCTCYDRKPIQILLILPRYLDGSYEILRIFIAGQIAQIIGNSLLQHAVVPGNDYDAGP